MPRLVRELHHLVFDGGTIPRPDRPRFARYREATAQCCLRESAAYLRSVRDVAFHLFAIDPLRQERERSRLSVALLRLKPAQSIVLPSSRGGVPVFRRVHCQPERSAVGLPAGSKAPLRCARSYTSALRRGPGHSGTSQSSQSRRRHEASGRPAAARRLPGAEPVASTLNAATSACMIRRFGSCSSTSRIRMRYCFLSHCARGDHTAGPRLVLSSRNWIPTASVTSPITPPSASISRTKVPFRDTARRPDCTTSARSGPGSSSPWRFSAPSGRTRAPLRSRHARRRSRPRHTSETSPFA